MPVRCAVPGCENMMTFRFPKNPEQKRKWLLAIRRPDLWPDYNPQPAGGICEKHFKPSDLISESFEGGYMLSKRRLFRGAVPSVFSWGSEAVGVGTPKKRLIIRLVAPPKVRKIAVSDDDKDVQVLPSDFVVCDYGGKTNVNVGNNSKDTSEVINDQIVHPTANVKEQAIIVQQFPKPNDYTVKGIHEKIKDTTSVAVGNNSKCETPENNYHTITFVREKITAQRVLYTKSTQTFRRRSIYSINDFVAKPKLLFYLTGLESYETFMTVFKSCSSNFSLLKYKAHNVEHVSKMDQLFLTLWKLRLGTPFVELGLHFDLSTCTASNIVYSWVQFMARVWRTSDFWPPEELRNVFMSFIYKKKYPTLKMILDTLELSSPPNIDRNANQSCTAGRSKDSIVLEFEDINGQSKSSTVPNQNSQVGEKLSKAQIEHYITSAKNFKILFPVLHTKYIPIGTEIFCVCALLGKFNRGITKEGDN